MCSGIVTKKNESYSELEVIAQLHNIEIFSELSSTAIQELAKISTVESYSKGNYILHAEENSTDMYGILSGSVRVLNYAMSGREIVYDDILAGGIFGEICALDGLGRSANVVAIDDLVLVKFSREAFLETIECYPQVAISLSKHLVAIIRAAGRRIIDTSTKSSRLRILSVIAAMIPEAEELEGNQLLIKTFPTHKVLAGRVGCTRETITRLLNSLSEEGLIERRGSDLCIYDMPRLLNLLKSDQIY